MYARFFDSFLISLPNDTMFRYGISYELVSLGIRVYAIKTEQISHCP